MIQWTLTALFVEWPMLDLK